LRARYRSPETMAVFPAEVLVELYATLGDARDLVTLLAGVTQTLVMLAIFLAVFAALTPRRRQLGVLRALGASRGYIFAAVWLHVPLLVGMGAGLGLMFGWLGAIGVSWLFHARTGVALPVTLSAREIGAAAALIGAGALLATIPAWLGYRQSVSA